MNYMLRASLSSEVCLQRRKLAARKSDIDTTDLAEVSSINSQNQNPILIFARKAKIQIQCMSLEKKRPEIVISKNQQIKINALNAASRLKLEKKE